MTFLAVKSCFKLSSNNWHTQTSVVYRLKHQEYGGTVVSTVVSEQESPELECSIGARPKGHMWCNTHDQ